MSGRFLYTIEQLELIRRLRNSGLSRDQVLLAVDSFERLERQLGFVDSASKASMTESMLTFASGIRSFVSTSSLGLSQSVPLKPLHQQTVKQQLLQIQQKSALQARQYGTYSLDLIKSDPHNLPQVMCGVDASVTTSDHIPQKMKDFLTKDESTACEEIKSFIVKHNIKQQQIASLAGVSQPYVSRYLKGDFTNMSERSCGAIKKWFITYQNNPEAIGHAAHVVAQNNPSMKVMASHAEHMSVASVSPSAADVADVLPSQRRERFLFGATHLDVLECSFAKDNYPSPEMREEIARRCNKATKHLYGRELTPKELISTQTVTTWFANKRKDLKRNSRDDVLQFCGHRRIQVNTQAPVIDLVPSHSICPASLMSDVRDYSDVECESSMSDNGLARVILADVPQLIPERCETLC